jgi:hypothetical protein
MSMTLKWLTQASPYYYYIYISSSAFLPNPNKMLQNTALLCSPIWLFSDFYHIIIIIIVSLLDRFLSAVLFSLCVILGKKKLFNIFHFLYIMEDLR